MKKFSFVFILFSLFTSLYANEATITYNGSGNYELTERTDLRRYDNGRYTGLVSREVQSFIIPLAEDNGYLYDGTFYIDEKTRRNMRMAGISINDAIPAVFKIDDKGKLTMIEDNGFPSYRSFPSYPNVPITIGTSWEGKAERAVDPLNKGVVTRMPIYVRYTYTGDTVFDNQDVYVISAQFATRYGFGTGNYYKDWGGDEELESASGSHHCSIYVSKKTGNALLIKDNLDETYIYNDGNQIRFKGTISLFTKYPPTIDRTEILPILKRIANLTDDEVEQLSDPTFITKETFIDSDLIALSDSTSHHDTIWEHVDSSLNEYDTEEYNKIEDKVYTHNFDDNIKNTISNQDSTSDIDIKVSNTKAGLRLTIHNLQFLPDSAKLLPGQMDKLEEIAQLLKTIPNGRFLIEGHTASTGYEKGEMKLSLERAESIATKFISKGLQEDQFICRGYGGKKPIADNSTSEGKALNRRVEITILD